MEGEELVILSSYCTARWRGWWNTPLRLFAELQLLQQDPPVCSQTTDHLWAGTRPRRYFAPPHDTDSGSCSGSERWSWCCHLSARRATEGQREENVCFDSASFCHLKLISDHFRLFGIINVNVMTSVLFLVEFLNLNLKKRVHWMTFLVH